MWGHRIASRAARPSKGSTISARRMACCARRRRSRLARFFTEPKRRPRNVPLHEVQAPSADSGDACVAYERSELFGLAFAQAAGRCGNHWGVGAGTSVPRAYLPAPRELSRSRGEISPWTRVPAEKVPRFPPVCTACLLRRAQVLTAAREGICRVRLIRMGPESVHEGVERAIAAIRRNATALAHMIDDLLDTSRILNGAIRLALRPVDLAVVAHGALDAVRPFAARKNVQLGFEVVPDSGTISGDAERLQQAIWNLLANAIKFTPEGGRVDMVIEPATDHVEVRVVDTGQGISPELLPYVFEHHRQADDATTERHPGLGLGLGIACYLVELQGGTLQAASPGVAQGATFIVRLPLAAGAPEGPSFPRKSAW